MLRSCSILRGALTVAAAMLTCAGHAASPAYSAFSIGNSLTWDSQPDGIAAMAASQGLTLLVGYHIRSSQTLAYIAANPMDVTLINSYGAFNVALPDNSWSFVTLEPFPDYAGGTSTLATDLKAIGLFMNETQAGSSSNPIFYIYAAWPPIPCWCYPAQPGNTYAYWWNLASANNPASPTYLVRQYFSNLYQDTVATYPDVPVFMIPLGEVLAQLDQDIGAGQFPEFGSIFDLYRDDYHLSFDVGRFVAAATVYAVYFGRSPVGIQVPAGFYTVDGTATGAPGLLAADPSLRDRLEQVVWDVVSSDFRTGVAIAPSVSASALNVTFAQSVTLSVTPRGPGPFSYQWYQGLSGDISVPVDGQSPAYTTPPLAASTSYWVQITSAIGIVENSTSVTVTVAARSNVASANAPLSPWALGLLGITLMAVATRRLAA